MIYHITTRKDWRTALGTGRYQAESFVTEGFIHRSTLSQVLPVAERFYEGQSGLILLVIDEALLSSTLKWESPSGGTPPPGVPEGDSFPHIYGPINLEAVVKVVDLTRNANAAFTLPDF